jgi:hypothetical protein
VDEELFKAASVAETELVGQKGMERHFKPYPSAVAQCVKEDKVKLEDVKSVVILSAIQDTFRTSCGREFRSFETQSNILLVSMYDKTAETESDR